MDNPNFVRKIGRVGITATVVQDSIDARSSTRLTTFELEYPRFIHSEFMTHRMLSRNAASSRAIPTTKLIDLVKKKPATPVEWGKNKLGMQATDTLLLPDMLSAQHYWQQAADDAVNAATKMNKIGVHKQITNRVLEPYQFIKVVCTATEYDNFFHLRNHSDAQPEIKELAHVMLMARNSSHPVTIGEGQWHVPYVDREIKNDNIQYYVTNKEDGMVYVDADTAIMISASCCAQVSYRVLNNDIAKAEDIYARLVESKPVHASPFEHQATPITNLSNSYNIPDSWEKGVTHRDRGGQVWSGNFRNWIQHRQLIDDHVCWKYSGGSNET